MIVRNKSPLWEDNGLNKNKKFINKGSDVICNYYNTKHLSCQDPILAY